VKRQIVSVCLLSGVTSKSYEKNLMTLNIPSYTSSYFVKLTNSVAPEPDGSSPCSQDPAASPYPEPTESTPHAQANILKIHSHSILPPTPRSSEWLHNNKMAVCLEAASNSGTSVNFYETKRSNNPEDSHLRIHRCKNLKYYVVWRLREFFRFDGDTP
jgi:hypothetical protein